MLLAAILAVTRPGDEVIVLDPCYDSYVPEYNLGTMENPGCITFNESV